MTDSAAQRIKLHVYTSQSPALLLRVVRFLCAQSIAVEVGNTFVKFPRGPAAADQAAIDLKAMGFKVLNSVDDFSEDSLHNMKARSAAALEAENTPKGHVHGPGCGHDHHHDHSHDHHHDHAHDHAHDHSHQHEHRHEHGHEHQHRDQSHDHDHKH